jgi:hypothetical protein
MLGAIGRFFVALRHVVGLLLLVLATELGIDSWRRLSRCRRPTRPDRSASADAYGGADWSTAYFDEFRRAVRVEWKPYVEWWQRPCDGAYVTLHERGLRRTPGEKAASGWALRILCFGGSTTMGMGERDEERSPQCWPTALPSLDIAFQ